MAKSRFRIIALKPIMPEGKDEKTIARQQPWVGMTISILRFISVRIPPVRRHTRSSMFLEKR